MFRNILVLALIALAVVTIPVQGTSESGEIRQILQRIQTLKDNRNIDEILNIESEITHLASKPVQITESASGTSMSPKKLKRTKTMSKMLSSIHKAVTKNSGAICGHEKDIMKFAVKRGE
ncbi:uncharacterized protein LOC116342340 [Contarinia nasturtii]|uniref:uncharacterized protein LOC116342340 n=1 Tax=Contarinia nasturtii TaxID=265458 RepID=UPI0012D44240|nr:uncharacterized protein LOC116342340 [Contarinia nasturtii]